MAEICPQIIVRAASTAAGNVIPLLDSSNTANLERIICNIPEPVLLRLLVCRDEKKQPDICPYPEYINEEAVKWACRIVDIKLAQIYIRHEIFHSKARSCVVIFIEGKYLYKTNEITKIFLDTVNFLNITNEKPYLHVLYFGDPQIGLITKQVGTELNEKIRGIFEGYSDAEDICIMSSVRRDAKPLIINCSSKYSFTAS